MNVQKSLFNLIKINNCLMEVIWCQLKHSHPCLLSCSILLKLESTVFSRSITSLKKLCLLKCSNTALWLCMALYIHPLNSFDPPSSLCLHSWRVCLLKPTCQILSSSCPVLLSLICDTISTEQINVKSFHLKGHVYIRMKAKELHVNVGTNYN